MLECWKREQMYKIGNKGDTKIEVRTMKSEVKTMKSEGNEFEFYKNRNSSVGRIGRGL